MDTSSCPPCILEVNQMAVFRIEKNKNCTVMANYHLRDISLSLKAKGLLSLMLSLPEIGTTPPRGLPASVRMVWTAFVPQSKSWKKPDMSSADGSEMSWGISRRSSIRFWRSLSAQQLRRSRCPTPPKKPAPHLNGKIQFWMILFWIYLNRQFLNRRNLNRKNPPN